MMTVFDVVALTSITVALTALIMESVKRFLLTLPRMAWRWVVDRFTLSVTLAAGDESFNMLRDWLAAHPYAKKARRVKLQYSPAAGKAILVPGHGSHLLWFDGPLWIRFSTVKHSAPGSDTSYEQEHYAITMLAMHHEKMERFLGELAQFKKKDVARLNVYTWRGGYWNWFGSRRKRDLGTVYMPEATKGAILAAIVKFQASEEWYAIRGIPWRLGILLEGGPGTGKTTLASAIAGYFDKPLYSMNLNSVGSDDALLASFSSAQRDGIVLIEDADGFEAAKDRGNIERETEATAPDQPPETAMSKALGDLQKALGSSGYGAAAPGTLAKEKGSGVTISGLLNAIDGVTATEGRILIMTTNDASKLDPALLRSGRIDLRFAIGHLGPDDVVEMAKCFYPDAVSSQLAQIRVLACDRSKTAAAWQKILIRNHDSIDTFLAEFHA